MSKPSILDAVKIQATVLIPVVKALESELGKGTTARIVLPLDAPSEAVEAPAEAPTVSAA